jgi:hypothetical protein
MGLGHRDARRSGGAFILAGFVAMFNYLTPSGSFVIVARVVEINCGFSPATSSRILPTKTSAPRPSLRLARVAGAPDGSP